jgi:cyanate permease
VLLPLLDNNWRSVMTLWAVLSCLAAMCWLIISLLARRQFNAALAPASAADNLASRGSIRSILRLPGVKLVLLMSVGVFLYNHGLNNWLPELLRTGGMTATQSGYWAALPMLVGIIGSLTIPRLAIPERRFKILLGLCLAAALASLALQFQQPAVLTSALILQGLVRASMMTVLILTLMELPGMDPRQTGTASGMFFSAAEVGGVIGPLGLGLLYDATGGFSASLYALTAVAAAMAAGTWLLARHNRSD